MLYLVKSKLKSLGRSFQICLMLYMPSTESIFLCTFGHLRDLPVGFENWHHKHYIEHFFSKQRCIYTKQHTISL